MTPNGSLADDLGFLLSRASGVVARAASAELAELGLRIRSYSVLGFVSDSGDGLTQRRLATLLGLDPSQIVALVDELEARELVTRTPDPADRRHKLIVATDDGHRLRAEAAQRVEQSHNRCFAHLPQRRRDELRQVLRQIVFGEGAPAEFCPVHRG